ncbi:DUF6346 domain-containing protein [Saccharopolyspora hordei]|uniref:Uncharacterized protein n=1 Tax=Saccharopolyspora hordei TaxID=1838 RepID=A0A853AQT5_9PSEU|nr:DUF6346 domain-containing protein [Saccharopolyspora hordei]NYI83231.1 hypothetical protein [Saccharopolyspora hordei]
MGSQSAAPAGEAARNPRTPPWRRPWAELPREERFWRTAFVASQVLVRVVIALVCYTVFVLTGAVASDGAVTDRGTALATHCERVGPISRSGLGWYWSCEAEVTWSDGRTTREEFPSSQLTPRNTTEPAPVVHRDVRDAADQVVVDAPRPFAVLGWVMLVALTGLLVHGVWVPGVPPMPADRRAERRRRVRLQWWQPLAAPIGWGLLVAGGLGAASPTASGLSVLAIVLGFGALVTAWAVSLNRRRKGVVEPRELPPELTARWGKVGGWLLVLGGIAAVAGLGTTLPDPVGVVGVLALPCAVIAVGWRVKVVASRRSRGTDPGGTASIWTTAG